MKAETIDLHMHSYYSDDGEFPPEELVEQCARCGVAVMAIADHNSVRAIAREQAAAQAAGIICIPAIEIDCTFGGANFHVLGYGIDSTDPNFAKIEENIGSQSRAASVRMLQATRELGFSVTEEEMEALAAGHFFQDRWTGEMFAEVLLGRPEYRKHPLLLPYRAGGARGDNPFVNFYWDYYSQGKPCYAKILFPELARVVEIIHESGGRAVLAHPGVNLKGREELLDPVLQTGIDGIEAFSSYHTAAQSDCYCKEAWARGLFVTCGSDYHGKTKPAIHLGGHGCTLAVSRLKWEI